ncbi:Aste57867_9024 [Aphanomyces stellatus]|uniref:Aste57867_9024 protein n=1 Tax=Aphanomyces stellatus TaxID=120398 RepID=A0A485KLY2_9STRA|nr:hypothetical protein As57867_008988 [Aphanomyces stellatus]VFT85908.1 Aste57867_9024 [Aphanomyces stellatus]
MGGSISMLRADIKAHVKIAHDYADFLEPNLCVARFFLELCEEGEGITPKDRDNPEFLERIKDDEMDVSTEVELVAENEDAVEILVANMEKYAALVPAPEFDTKKRYFARFRTPDPFPDYYAPVDDVDIERCRVSVLRHVLMSLRCLRMVTVIGDVKKLLYNRDCITPLNRVVDENPLDEYIRKDVKAVLKNVFGGDYSLRRLETSSLAGTVEIINDFVEMDHVQVAAIKRLSFLLGQYPDLNQCKADVISHGVLPAIGGVLQTFPESYFDIYAHACRLFTVLVPTRVLKEDHEAGLPHDETLAKIIGQHGGVEAAIKLLKTCRGFYATTFAPAEPKPKAPKGRKPPTPPSPEGRPPSTSVRDIMRADYVGPDGGGGNQNETETPKTKLTDWTTPDLAQQALWALDVLTITEFNRVTMKREKLKFVLSEVTLGSKLIVPRRLRLLRWDDIGGEKE